MTERPNKPDPELFQFWKRDRRISRRHQGLLVFFTVLFVALVVTGVTGKIKPSMKMPGDKLERIRKERNEIRTRLEHSERNLKYAEFMGRINSGRHKIEQAKRKEAEKKIADLESQLAEVDEMSLARRKVIADKQAEIQKLQEQTNQAQGRIGDEIEKNTQSSRGLPRIEQLPSEGVEAGPTFSGKASWYGGKFAGRKTASGSTFNPSELTAAHKSLSFGTTVKVTNRANGKAVTVRITDRGPYIPGRIIDLSEAAFKAIAPLGAGVINVTCEVLK